jgi:hypothetical protein
MKSLSMIILFFLFLFFFSFLICQSIHPTSHPVSPKTYKRNTSDSHVIPHKLCANVLMSNPIKQVNSQLSKVSDQTLKLYHHIMCSKF